MCDETTLYPPPPLIHARLTSIAREQRRLRALLNLAIEARDDAADRSLAERSKEKQPGKAQAVA
jgi:hypothetical protein